MCLSRNKDNFQTAECDCIINRYVPIALSGIYQSMIENGPEEERKDKTIQEKYQDNIGIIKEESDSSDNNLSSEDEKEDNNEETEEEVIETNTKIEEEINDESDLSSFSLISKGEFTQDFDHLSNFDPEDDFLKSESSYSIIGSVISKDAESLSQIQ